MSKKFNCSMQKKIESLAKKSETKKSESDETSWALDSLAETAKEKGLKVSWEGANEICITIGTAPHTDHIYVTDDAPGKEDTSLELYVPAAHINTSGLTLQDVLDYLDDPIGKRDAVQFKNGNRSGKVETKKSEGIEEDATIATSDIKKALNEVANEVKPNVDEVRVEDNLDIVGPGARAEIYIDSAGDKIWWFTVKTKDNSIEVTDPDNEDHNYGKFNDIEGMKDLFKKFLQEDIKNDTISANDALKDEPEEVQVMVRELAKETGNNYGDAAIESYAPGNGVCVTFGNEEYYCYADYNDAEEASNEGVKGLLEEEGVSFIRFENLGGIEQFLDVDWFKDAQREDAEFYVSDIKESEPERYKEEFGDIDEEDAVEKCLADWGDDYIQWFKDNFGEKELDTVIKENNLVDLDALAEAITEADGPANELASYDGEEIELPCGYYCYRHN